ncbi:MAG: FAD-dependent oxidoreductase [Candidatus Hodarchaeales archaeon]
MKVGIIGAGIGGSSAAYYLKEKQPDIDITIYESLDILGGRLFNRKFGNITNELGGTFFHSVNKNIVELVEAFNLETENYVYPRFGIWDGSRFIFRSSQSSLVTNLKLLLRYRLTLFKLNGLIKKAKKRLNQLYQKTDGVFESFEDLFTNGNINEWISTSFNDLLVSEGISRKFIDEIIEPSTRLIYTQNVHICGFAGLATLISSDGTPIMKLVQGNSTLPKKLIETSKAELKLNHRVKSLEKGKDNKIIVSGDNFSEKFGKIIIACPIEQCKLEFKEISLPVFEYRSFQKVYIKIIIGDVKPSYFGVNKAEEIPELLMTKANSDIPFNSLENLGKDDEGRTFYNLISTQPITENLINDLFSKTYYIEDHTWEYAYPISKAIQKMQPCKLSENIYYINGIESSASTMEASALGAKTVVNLLIKDIQQ